MKHRCNNQSLPSDLMPDIFVNLPIMSLVRFSCSCKYFLRYIKCPEFAMRHFLTSSTSSPCIIEYVPTMDISTKHVTLKMYLFSLTKTKTLHLERMFEVGRATDVLVSNYCHGVTCLYLANTYYDRKMVLFNPAIREVVEVPLFGCIHTDMLGIGIGFDSKSNDYKIMITSDLGVEVYSVRNGTWRYISSEKYSISGKHKSAWNGKDRILNLRGYERGVWTVELLSFDVVDEVFWSTPMPKCSCPKLENPFEPMDQHHTHHLLPSSYWQAVICCSSPGLVGNGAIDIWVLIERDDYHKAIWSKHASFVIPIERYLVSPVDVWMNDVEVFLQLKKKEKCEVHSAEMFVYNITNKELKLIQELKPIGEGSFYDVGVYKESLISIKSIASSHKEEDKIIQYPRKRGNEVARQKALELSSPYSVREILRENVVGWSHKLN